MSREYQDKEKLAQLYHENGLSGVEIAERYSVSTTTIYHWLDKHDIKTDGRRKDAEIDTSYREQEVLEKLYVEKRLSSYEIADMYGVDQPAVWNMLKKHDIPTRKSKRDIHGNFTLSTGGYPMFQTKVGGENKQVRIHRLVVAAEHGVDSVVGKHVHHKNGVKWDNRPENLEITTPSKHGRLHYSEREIDDRGQFSRAGCMEDIE